MAYLSASDVVSRIGSAAALQLTTDSGSTVDTSLITSIIAEAEADVVTAVRKRTRATITEADYPLTWSLIVGKVLDLAIYRLALRRPPVPEDWKLAYTHAVEWLTRLAAGEVDLPDVGANAPDPTYDFAREDAGAEDMI